MKIDLSKQFRLVFAKVPELYYDAQGENLYVVDTDNHIYKYADITYSTWGVIIGGDWEFFDTITEVMPYKTVYNLPKTKHLETYTLPQPSVTMYKVKSSNLEYVGYDEQDNSLYVQFLNGDIYKYYNVEQEIWDGFIQADSKGSYLNWFVKINGYQYEKIGGFMLDWSGKLLQPNTGSPHPNGYMTGFKKE